MQRIQSIRPTEYSFFLNAKIEESLIFSLILDSREYYQ